MMRRHWLLPTLGTLILQAAFAGDDDSRRRVRLGGISAGASYMTGPAWYGPWSYGPGFYRPWWGLYDPFWSSPYLHSGLYRGFAAGPGMGQIKLNAPKEASVYLDGAFAGSAQKLKSIWLEPGVYELEVSNAAGHQYRKKVYVLSGKTLDIRAELRP
jgi:PEGA domain